MKNELKIIADGKSYAGWEGVTIKRSMETLCGDFTVSMSDRFTPAGKSFFISAQAPIVLKIDNDEILTGYVDAVEPNYDENGLLITVSGRDKTADLVDCSAANTPGSFNKTTFKNIVAALIKPFGISAVYEVEISDRKMKFSIDAGASIFQTLEKLTALEGVLMQTDPAGRLVFPKNTFQRADTGLATGDNILRIRFPYDFTDRFSPYIVRGQAAGDGSTQWAKSQPVIGAFSVDPVVNRYRPLILQAETAATAASTLRRAQWERTIRRARALRGHVVVQGWRQTGSDQLWTTNQIVNVYAPKIRVVNLDLLISEVVFNKSESGAETRLTLVPKDSFILEPPPPPKPAGGKKLPWLR